MQQKNGMATAGMICGIISILLCWLPFAGLVLGVLGIVFGSIGMARSSRLGVGRGAGVAGLVTGILGFIMLPIMAAVAIPAFLEYMEKPKSSRANLELRAIETKVKVYFNEKLQLPPSAQMMPGDPAYQCSHLPVRSMREWEADPGWRAIGFHVDEPSQFAFTWTKLSETEGQAEALSDLDCDGVVSRLRVDFYVEQGNLRAVYNAATPD